MVGRIWTLFLWLGRRYADHVLVKTVVETEADLNSMTTGQVVRVRVSAVNDAGESLKREPVEQTVP